MSKYELSEKECRCTACNRVFSTESNFDRHRRGKYQPDERHCVPPESIGMKKNNRGTYMRDVPFSSRHNAETGEFSD